MVAFYTHERQCSSHQYAVGDYFRLVLRLRQTTTKDPRRFVKANESDVHQVGGVGHFE